MTCLVKRKTFHRPLVYRDLESMLFVIKHTTCNYELVLHQGWVEGLFHLLLQFLHRVGNRLNWLHVHHHESVQSFLGYQEEYHQLISNQHQYRWTDLTIEGVMGWTIFCPKLSTANIQLIAKDLPYPRILTHLRMIIGVNLPCDMMIPSPPLTIVEAALFDTERPTYEQRLEEQDPLPVYAQAMMLNLSQLKAAFSNIRCLRIEYREHHEDHLWEWIKDLPEGFRLVLYAESADHIKALPKECRVKLQQLDVSYAKRIVKNERYDEILHI